MVVTGSQTFNVQLQPQGFPLTIRVNVPDAAVYVDGGYAGTADKLKNLWLDPGAYDLAVSAPGRVDFHERLYVLSGKSLKITARLEAAEVKDKP